MSAQRTIQEAMAALYPRTHGPECADKYRAIAAWWRLHARLSMSPGEAISYARSQWKIAADMDARPRHHQHKPADVTRWQWTNQ